MKRRFGIAEAGARLRHCQAVRLADGLVKSVDLYGRVRHAVLIEGMSRREAARISGIDRRTVDKTLKFPIPPPCRRTKPVRRPRPDPFVGVIDAIPESDRSVPGKRKHTSKRVFERLRDEHGHVGGITMVKDDIPAAKQRRREMFVPFSHPPGHAQADPGEALAVIGGVERKIHLPVMELPHSDACFLKACPSEKTEAFRDAHVSAFEFLGGVPVSVLYDNTRIAVARILGDGKRKRTRVFSELVSHYLLEDRPGRPGKGNDKGKVEGMVGYTRRNVMVPRPRFASFDDLDAYLANQCRKRMNDKLRGHKGTIGERFTADVATLQPLPVVACDACDRQSVRVGSVSLVRHVRHRGNDHSVPTRYGHQQVLVRGHVHEVVIAHGTRIIARHLRSWEKEDTIFDPRHHLALIEQKTNALDQAAPLADRELADREEPQCFITLRRLLEARMGKAGKREFVQVLRLLETFQATDVVAGTTSALERGTIGLDAVRHLVSCRIDRRPPRLDMTVCPHLPKAHVAATSAGDYTALLSQGRS